LQDRKLGLADQWLKNVQDVRAKHWDQLSGMKKVLQFNRLCELNVIEQVLHVTETSISDAWERQQRISVHGWIYGVENGPAGSRPLHFTARRTKSVTRPQSIVLSKQPDSRSTVLATPHQY
jgi:carbonic anhydrase